MVFVPGTFLAEYRVARKFPVFSSDGWWINRWPFLGWLETAVKVIAFFVAAYVPLEEAGQYAPQAFSLDLAPFYCQTVLMWGASVLLTLGIIERLMLYREVVSMIFVFPNVWAHWNVFFALYRFGRGGISTQHFRIFCYLMLAGDIVKLIFFAVHDFSMLNIARYVSLIHIRAATVTCVRWGSRHSMSDFASFQLFVFRSPGDLFARILLCCSLYYRPSNRLWVSSCPQSLGSAVGYCHSSLLGQTSDRLVSDKQIPTQNLPQNLALLFRARFEIGT